MTRHGCEPWDDLIVSSPSGRGSTTRPRPLPQRHLQSIINATAAPTRPSMPVTSRWACRLSGSWATCTRRVQRRYLAEFCARRIMAESRRSTDATQPDDHPGPRRRGPDRAAGVGPVLVPQQALVELLLRGDEAVLRSHRGHFMPTAIPCSRRSARESADVASPAGISTGCTTARPLRRSPRWGHR